MKKILILGVITAIFLSGCEVNPYADFAVKNRAVQPQDIVYFSNLSEHSVSFDWDFGDGTFSNTFSPSHVYTKEGTYTVTLTAVSKDGNVDRVSIALEVYYTELEIEVAEWNEFETIEFIVENARVRIYLSYNDWFDQRNYVASGYTNAYGIVSFIGLDARSFYIDVQTFEDPFYDNSALGQDDISYILTPVLKPGYKTTFLAFADYYSPSMAKNKRTKSSVSIINKKRAALLNTDEIK